MQPQPMSSTVPFVADATDIGPTVGSHALPWLIICRLGPSDRAALAEHFLSLLRQDRRTRFGGNASDASIRRHCDDLDLAETVCFAALDAAGAVVGAAFGFAYGAGDGPHRRCVEVAVSVAPEHRRRGLGTDLVSRVHHATAACGADAAVFEFDPSNAAIRGLVRRLGGLVPPPADSCTIPLCTLH
jgi:ribosomal protein S18 acetylase RimI-like enzyme